MRQLLPHKLPAPRPAHLCNSQRATFRKPREITLVRPLSRISSCGAAGKLTSLSWLGICSTAAADVCLSRETALNMCTASGMLQSIFSTRVSLDVPLEQIYAQDKPSLTVQARPIVAWHVYIAHCRKRCCTIAAKGTTCFPWAFITVQLFSHIVYLNASLPGKSLRRKRSFN